MAEAFDVLLAVAILWSAWRAAVVPQQSTAVVAYIVFGLLVSIAWVRLEAPDVALAEAAIGAGLTGALLLQAARRRAARQQGAPSPAHASPRRPVVAALAATLAALLAVVVVSLPDDEPGLGPAVAERLDEAAVAQPVTAVLLDLRAYDTLLEVGVLLIAAVALIALRGPAAFAASGASGDRLLSGVAGVVAPVAVLAGAYLLWLGTTAPGGAFQAGAVIAAAGVLLVLAGRGLGALLEGLPVRALLAVGLAVFVGFGVATALAGQALAYPDGLGHALVLAIETGITVAAAITLAAFLAAARRVGRR
jgi:multisubunit Na+/H+ antiporter MnhB subunit